MKTWMLTLAWLCCYAFVQSQTIPSPAKSDELIIDLGTTGKADPGDRIRYTTIIQNTGISNANGTKMTVTPDSRTTLTPGSFRSAPIAVDDGPYACTGNLSISVPASTGVKANDFDDVLGSATLSVTTNPANGTVTLQNDGSFTYVPNAGFLGNDQFSYTITDSNPVGGPIPSTDVATVTITVSNLIWFIDNSSTAATSDGRLSSPFKTLADFNAGSTQTGDVIFIEAAGTNYSGGIVLQNNERLFGEGHTGGANLADVLPFTLAPNSPALPLINGSRPVIVNAAGDGVTLATNNTLRGFNVGDCSDFGMENTGANSVGNLSVSDISISNTTGGGFKAGNGGALSVTLTALTAHGGQNGIHINNCSGSFSAGSGSIMNPTGTAVLITNGSANVTYPGPISDDTGFAIDIDNHDIGNATFAGTITSTASGIRVQNCGGGGTKTFSGASKNLNTGANNAVTLANNAGSTIVFSGGNMTINTTSGTGFSATSSGTLTIEGANNVLNSTAGVGLTVTGTTIGVNNLNFERISSNGGANGIVINNTGSLGGLIVTGAGSAGSGGTIQNCTGTGISLATTAHPNLSYMIVQNNGDDGINGSAVNNMTLSNCSVTGNGNAALDEGIEFDNLNGVASFINCTVSNNAHHNFHLDNSSGTLAMLTVSGCTFSGHNSGNAFGGNGFFVEARQSAAITTISIPAGSVFSNNNLAGLQVSTTENATISSCTITGCTFSDTGTGNSQENGAVFSASVASNLTYQFINNQLTGHNSHAINTTTGAGGTGGVLRGTIQDNAIGSAGTIDSGSKTGIGIRANINGNTNARVKIHNNNLYQIPAGRGIEAISQNGGGSASFIVTNNTVNAPTGTAGTVCGAGVLCPKAPIHVETDCNSVCNSACAVVSGNGAYDPVAVPGGMGTEFSVQLVRSGASAFAYEGNTALSALDNLIAANPACVTKNVSGAVTVVNANSCPTP